MGETIISLREKGVYFSKVTFPVHKHTVCGWWEQAWNVGPRGEAVSMGLTTQGKDLRI